MNAKELSWRLLDAAREEGVERSVDLVLHVLFVRWMTHQASDSAVGERGWSSLLQAASDGELAERFSRLAIFQDDEGFSLVESKASAGVLRNIVNLVHFSIPDRPQTSALQLVSDTFDATLEHLSRLGKQSGEADTPRALARLMAALTVRPGDKVLDPVCGNATALVAAARSHPDVSVSGFDINARVARRASMRLMVSGIRPGDGFGVWVGDAFQEYAPNDSDVVLAQPPWGVMFSAGQKERIFDIAKRRGAAPGEMGFPKGDMPWLLLALDALKDGGRAAVLLSGSSLSTRCQVTHQHLLALGAVEAIISLPGGVFRHTGVPTALWLVRNPSEGQREHPVLMVDAQTLVERADKGRLNIAGDTEEALEAWIRSARTGEDVDAPGHVARLVPLKEINPAHGLHPETYLDDAPVELVTHPAPERTLLTQITLANFKAFGSRTTIPLAPLTLVYGANSAGKSSIIQSMLLLKQSRRANRLITQGPIVNVGGFQGILHGHTSADLELSLSYGVLPSWIPADGTPHPTLARTVTWVFAPDSAGQGVPGKITYAFGDYQLPLHRDPDADVVHLGLDDATEVFKGVATGTLLYPFDARQHPDGDQQEQAKRLQSRVNTSRRALRILERNNIEALSIRASGLLPTGEAIDLRVGGAAADREPGIANSYVNRTARLAGGISQEVEALLDSLVWLGPLRSAPQRFYDRADTASTPGDGKHVAIYLFDHASVVEQVNDWLQRLEVPYTLDVVPVTAGSAASLVGDLVAISLADRRSGVNVTPADVGFGISQMLPIVVELLSRRESVIAVEQPETHLHPRLQARLADLFIDTAQEGGRANQLIIETHSEHLMLRIQRRMREGALDPHDVSVIYVDQDQAGQATVSALELNEQGEFLDEWPHGFFDDRLEELFGEF